LNVIMSRIATAFDECTSMSTLFQKLADRMQYIIQEYHNSTERPYIIRQRLKVTMLNLLRLMVIGYDIRYEYIEELITSYNERTIHYLKDEYIELFVKLLPYNYPIHYTLTYSFKTSIIEELNRKNIRVTFDARDQYDHIRDNLNIARISLLACSTIIHKNQFILAQMLMYLQVPFTATEPEDSECNTIDVNVNGVELSLIIRYITKSRRDNLKNEKLNVDQLVNDIINDSNGTSILFARWNLERLLIQFLLYPQPVSFTLEFYEAMFKVDPDTGRVMLLTLHNQGFINIENCTGLHEKVEEIVNMKVSKSTKSIKSKNARRL
jgi:hypothetical protein